MSPIGLKPFQVESAKLLNDALLCVPVELGECRTLPERSFQPCAVAALFEKRYELLSSIGAGGSCFCDLCDIGVFRFFFELIEADDVA